MEIISKISKGTKMDQIYIPKNRYGLNTGDYVKIIPLEESQKNYNPYFYNLKKIEPIKIKIISEIFDKILSKLDVENIIITGSFIREGFNFQDIDILIILNETQKEIRLNLQDSLGINTHIIYITKKELLKGLSTEPLFQNMTSKFISLKRIIFNYKQEIKKEILDLSLLKSETIFYNFDFMNGKQKYELLRNIISIKLFLAKRKIDEETIEKEIKKTLGFEVESIKNNMLKKDDFLERLNKIYKELKANILNYEN